MKTISYSILPISAVQWTRLRQWVITSCSLKTAVAIPSPGECQTLCLVTSGCLSINYVQSNGECSLNNCTRLDAGTGYKHRETTDYYEYYFTPLGEIFCWSSTYMILSSTHSQSNAKHAYICYLRNTLTPLFTYYQLCLFLLWACQLYRINHVISQNLCVGCLDSL